MFNSFNPIKPAALSGQSRTSLDDTADIRDSVTALVGKGYTGLSDDDARAHFTKLSGILGKDKAQKLLTNIFIHNQSENVKGKGVQDRVNYFYDTNFQDPDINSIVKNAKNFGSGVMAGMNNSPDLMNMQLTNRFVPAGMIGMLPTDKMQSIVSNVIR